MSYRSPNGDMSADWPVWPQDIRRALAPHKRAGTPFDEAWAQAITAHPPCSAWKSHVRTVREHMRLGYTNELRSSTLAAA